MKRLHFTRCRTSLLAAVLLAFSVAFVPVPPISDTSSDSAALITTAQAAQKNTKDRFSIKEVPKYNGKSSVAVHGNKPYFTSREKQNTNTFESYHKLDKLGRCGVVLCQCEQRHHADRSARGNRSDPVIRLAHRQIHRCRGRQLSV